LTKIRSVILIITLWALSGLSQPVPLIDRIKANYSGKTALSTDVDLHIEWKVREKQENARGTIVLAPGDKFRASLGNLLWVSDGSTLWQYDKELSQVVIKPLANIGASMLPSQAIVIYCSKYSFILTKGPGNDAVLEWKADSLSSPQEHGALRIRITADNARAAVKQLLIVDASGNETTYTFGHTRFGKAVPAKTFTFIIPEGVRILDNR
jgi:outer membrane lipoprotein-sorting protein